MWHVPLHRDGSARQLPECNCKLGELDTRHGLPPGAYESVHGGVDSRRVVFGQNRLKGGSENEVEIRCGLLRHALLITPDFVIKALQNVTDDVGIRRSANFSSKSMRSRVMSCGRCSAIHLQGLPVRFKFGLLEDCRDWDTGSRLGTDRIHAPFFPVHQDHHSNDLNVCLAALADGVDCGPACGDNIINHDHAPPGQPSMNFIIPWLLADLRTVKESTCRPIVWL